MPISGPSSYLPTTDEFIAHWTSANAALGVNGPILLADSMSVAGLTALRDTLADQRAAVESARNEQEGARADLTALKASLLERLGQFRGKIASLSPGSRWIAMLPKSYSVSDGIGKVIPPLDDMLDLWTRYEVAEPAINLLGGYSIDDLTDQLEALKAAYQAIGSAENAVKLARADRNETQDAIRRVLVQYRQRIPAEFAEGSAILASLPRLSPPDGSTPDPVELGGTYDEAAQQAELGWSEVTDPDVTTLQLRATAGPDYEADDETVVANFPAATEPRVWTGTWGLTVPGAAASFKLYTLTAQGNERGSNTVTLTRPPA